MCRGLITNEARVKTIQERSNFPLVWIETKRAIIVATYIMPITASIRLNARAAGDAGVMSP